MSQKTVDDVLMIYQTLTPQEKKKIKNGIQLFERPLPPCQAKGHKFMMLGKVMRWFQPPATKAVCTQCGLVKII